MELQEKIKEYKIYLIIAGIIVGLITFNIYTLTLVNKDTEEEQIYPVKEKETKNKKIKIDIKGEIKVAGVYELDFGSRVVDAINKAGGITKQADTSIINLSKKLDDEMVVIVYSKNEVISLKKSEKTDIKEICPKINDACPEKVIEAIDKKETNNNSSTKKISINTATKEQLQALEGVGESKAKAIINYREENGNFKTIEDIKKVSGIGNSAFEKIKDNITV